MWTTKAKRFIGEKPNPKQDFLDTQFAINSVPEDKPWHTVTRGDYESLPIPLCAWRWTDEQMKALADAIAMSFDYEHYYTELIEDGTDAETAFECANNEWWKAMEDCAIELGMRYYDDFTEDEINQDKEDWEKFDPINTL